MPPAYELLLLNTAVPQIQAAQAGDTYVVPRDIAFSAALTLSAGTANGVPYLNGSKVLTTGSALTFDGTNFATTGSATATLLAATKAGQALVYVTDTSSSASQFAISAQTGNETWLGTTTNNPLAFRVNGTEQMRLTSKAFMVGYTDDSGFSGQYNAAFSGNVGIGTSSPAAKLDVLSSGVARLMIGYAGVSGNYYDADSHIFRSQSGTDRLLIDPSGNLGLGVTPSAWGSGNRFLDVNLSASYGAFGSTDTMMLANAYWNGSAWIRKNNNNAFRFVIESVSSSPTMTWQVAANSTAGSTISWTQAMTLDASGNLLVGGTSNDPFGRGFTGTRVVFGNNSGETGLTFRSGTGTASYFEFGTDTTLLFSLSGNASAGTTIKTVTAVPLIFGTNNGERARITSGGNFKIGGSADRATTEGDRQLVIFDGTAPVGTLANGISLYSSSGEAYVMDAAGNATLFSPHDAATNEWIFRSKHTPTGKVLKIDVERLLKFVNDHFGLDAVHEFIED